MKKLNRFYLFVLIVTLSGFALPKKELKITYVANCGFIYQSGTSKVLIDPFGTEFGNFFYLASTVTTENIVKGNIPFDKIDLLLITHIHGDHFNASLAERFLLNNRKAKMICPSQVYRQMQDTCSRFAEIKSQIMSPDLAINASKQLKVNGISVTAIRMQHGTNRSLDGVSTSEYSDYEKTENLGYVIRFDKKKIFHQGDACLKINEKALKNIEGPIDIAHLGFFDWDSTSVGLLKKELRAEKIIFMHGTKPAKELEQETFKKITNHLLFFSKELESHSF